MRIWNGLKGIIFAEDSFHKPIEEPLKRIGNYMEVSEGIDSIYAILVGGIVAIGIISLSWFLFYTVPSWRERLIELQK